MPHSGAFGLFLTLHILSAIFIIGPLGAVTAAAPRLVLLGQPALPKLRVALRITRRYPLATAVVAAFGAVIIREGSFGSVREITDFWLLWSIILWLAAILITLTLVASGLARAISAIEAGGDARRQLPMVTLGSAAAVFCWVAVISLMVVKPGM